MARNVQTAEAAFEAAVRRGVWETAEFATKLKPYGFPAEISRYTVTSP